MPRARVTVRAGVDVIIIGGGPAALSAALYSSRSRLNTVVFNGSLSSGLDIGGQLTTTTEIENYPGVPITTQGHALVDSMRSQCEAFGARIIGETVLSVGLKDRPFMVTTDAGRVMFGKVLIVATGSVARKIEIDSDAEDRYWQRGVSACAVCDGALPMFRNKRVAVIGGGDSAMEEALFLAKYASEVYIVHRRNDLRASAIMKERAVHHPKISILYSIEVSYLKGNEKLESICLKDTLNGSVTDMEVAGLFFAIGHEPQTKFLDGQLELDAGGYIITKPKSTATSVEGVFAAGDVQDAKYRQAVTAAGSGCMAALDANAYICDNRL